MPNKIDLKDLLWWGFSALLGVTSVWLISVWGVEARGLSGMFLLHLALLVSGAIVGFLKPERVWRWGIGCVLPLPVIYVLEKAVSQSPGSLSVTDSLLVVVFIKTPVYALQTLPAIVGAYLGAVARLGVPSSEEIKKTLKEVRFWILGILLGMASAGIPLISAQLANPEINAFHRPIVTLVWGVGMFISVTVMMLLQMDRTRVSWLAVVLGSIAGVVLKVLVDVLQDPGTTQSLSLAIIFSLFFVAPCAFGGVLIGTWIKAK